MYSVLEGEIDKGDGIFRKTGVAAFGKISCSFTQKSVWLFVEIDGNLTCKFSFHCKLLFFKG